MRRVALPPIVDVWLFLLTYVPSHRPRGLLGEEHMLFTKKVTLQEGYATKQVLVLAISPTKY